LANRQGEQVRANYPNASQFDRMTAGERLPLSVFIARLLRIAGLIGLIAFAIAG
jgi:hypothetical protein